jgi:hypothetical protein
VHDVQVLHHHQRVRADALGHIHGDHAVRDLVGTAILLRHQVGRREGLGHTLHQLEALQVEEAGMHGRGVACLRGRLAQRLQIGGLCGSHRAYPLNLQVE